MTALAFLSMREESQNWDEGIYVAAGYSYLKTDDFRMNPEHPPLIKILDALPLLALNPILPLGDPSWKNSDEVAFGRTFLYHNRVRADAILLVSRSVTIVLTAILGFLLFAWVRWRAGDAAALMALVLFAFDPNVVANGRYATNDIGVTLFAFAAVVAFDRALGEAGWRWYALAGFALGAALATKFSALFVLPVFVILAAVRYKSWRSISLRLPIVAAAAAAVMLIVSHGDVNVYIKSVNWSIGHAGGGALSYLFGMDSTQGWWWYFPAAFVLKSPVGLLLLVVVALVLLCRHGRELRDFAVLLAPIAVYGILAMLDRADIGIRYLLPIYPFLLALIGIICARHAPRALTVACVALVVIESVAVYPTYTAFFNVLVGGPGSGPRYLLDSNIDWGQDAKRLANWLHAHGTDEVCSSYFGNVPLDYYGIKQIADPPTQATVLAGKAPNCYVAISVNYLYSDAILRSTNNRWLRNSQPLAKVGYSIYVFDFRGRDGRHTSER